MALLKSGLLTFLLAGALAIGITLHYTHHPAVSAFVCWGVVLVGISARLWRRR